MCVCVCVSVSVCVANLGVLSSEGYRYFIFVPVSKAKDWPAKDGRGEEKSKGEKRERGKRETRKMVTNKGEGQQSKLSGHITLLLTAHTKNRFWYL